MAVRVIELHLGCQLLIGLRLGMETREEVHRPLLVRHILGMLEGQIEKAPPVERQTKIEAAPERCIRDLPRPCITQERLRLAAIDIARHLVEQNEERKAAIRRLLPVVECATLRCMYGGTKPRADIVVESLVTLEPQRPGAFGEPEIENCARVGHAETGPTSFNSAMRAMAGRARTFSARRFTLGKR